MAKFDFMKMINDKKDKAKGKAKPAKGKPVAPKKKPKKGKY